MHLFVKIAIVCFVAKKLESRPIETATDVNLAEIRSKFYIVGADDLKDASENVNKPGWMKRQLVRFGDYAENVGAAMGSAGVKMTAFLERVCKILKAIVPIVVTVCRVGEFKFCGDAGALGITQDAGGALASDQPLSSSINLNEQDRK